MQPEISSLDLLAKPNKTPWHLRFGGKMKTEASAVVVGIALLVGSTADVLGQAYCDPPINDVCLHKTDGWSSSGYATMWIDFENLPSTKSGQGYEIIWHGLKKLQGRGVTRQFTYDDVSTYGLPDTIDTSYANFWWDAYSPWGGFGCTIYEGHWDYSGGSGEILLHD